MLNLSCFFVLSKEVEKGYMGAVFPMEYSQMHKAAARHFLKKAREKIRRADKIEKVSLRRNIRIAIALTLAQEVNRSGTLKRMLDKDADGRRIPPQRGGSAGNLRLVRYLAIGNSRQAQGRFAELIGRSLESPQRNQIADEVVARGPTVVLARLRRSRRLLCRPNRPSWRSFLPK